MKLTEEIRFYTDGKHGLFPGWIGVNELCNKYLLPIDDCCLSSLCCSTHTELHSVLERHTKIAYWFLRVSATVSNTKLSHFLLLFELYYTYIYICTCFVTQGLCKVAGKLSHGSSRTQAESDLQEVFETWERCCCTATSSQIPVGCFFIWIINNQKGLGLSSSSLFCFHFFLVVTMHWNI